MCLYIDDYGDYTHLDSGWRRARKHHECAECRRAISPGESYFFQTSIDHYANGFVTWKMCAHCRGLITVGAKLAGCPQAWYWEAVLDTYEGYGFAADILAHDLPRAARIRFLRLLILARRKWRDRNDTLVDVPQLEVAA